MTLRTTDLGKARQVLRYEPETGDFYWLKSGKKAGCEAPNGYVLIGIDGQLLLAHRVAWAFMTGEWSKAPHLDHINRKRNDNRFANLREASVSQNMANSGARSTSKSGIKGVSWCAATRKWRATIVFGGRQKSLGRHRELESAIAAYQAEARRLHGDFAASELGVTFYDLWEGT